MYMLNAYKRRRYARAALSRMARTYGHTLYSVEQDQHTITRDGWRYRCARCGDHANVTRDGNIYSYWMQPRNCSATRGPARGDGLSD